MLGLEACKSADRSKIIPASYNNEVKRISIPGLPRDIIPASPEGPQHPAPPSGFATPVPRLGSGFGSPEKIPGTPEIPSLDSKSGYKTPEDAENLSVRMHDVV